MSVEITDVKRTGPSRERVMFSDGSICYRIKAEKGFSWVNRDSGKKLESETMKRCEALYKKFNVALKNLLRQGK